MNMQNLTEFPDFMNKPLALPAGVLTTKHSSDIARGFMHQPTELTTQTLALLARLSAQDESLAEALAAWQPQSKAVALL